jgi:glucose-6-phosphate 1-epimerase
MKSLEAHQIPGRVTVFNGRGNLPAIRVESDQSVAEIYALGAHITHFQKQGEPPLLFMSEASEFEDGKPIRGGVPLVFPWFGPRDGFPPHGFARTARWELIAAQDQSDGSVRLHFQLPPDDAFEADFIVTVGASLTMEFSVTNTGTSDFSFESCLHTYFQIGGIHQIGITGLQGVRYLDKVRGAEFTETAEILRIEAETDRVYQDTTATVGIEDPALRRRILVRKSGSKSTVVWNPWVDKSKRMPDFGDEEYPHMVCVESGNVAENSITLAPGEVATMTVELESAPLE